MCEADIDEEEMEKLKLELRGGKLVVPRGAAPTVFYFLLHTTLYGDHLWSFVSTMKHLSNI